MTHTLIPTNRKALQINIDTNFYGSFAEIGGGQETARHFFLSGGASGTIAKSISAYDKGFSDALYNQGNVGRYVSEGRLKKMLHAEFKDLTDVLENKKDQLLFAFGNTVEILNYSKTNYSHGWMGMRFQLHPDSEPNEVIMHVKLLENDGLLQQRTLGTLGVNLIYACKYYHQYPNTFLQSLVDNLSMDRFRITMMRMSGPDLDYVDNKLLAVQLVKNGMTRSIMFDKNGDVQQPSDMLYKKNVLAFRGSFRPITYITKDILNSSMELFKKDEDFSRENTLSFCELTLNNLLKEGEVDDHDFLERIHMLNSIGQNVMVSEIREYYKLVDFFSQFKIKKLRIVMGIPALESVLDESYYQHLRGGILEAMAKLFPQNLKLYIYPTMQQGTDEIQTSKNITTNPKIKELYAFLQQNKYILDLNSSMTAQLHVKSREVLRMIQEGNPDWETYVPMSVAQMIKKKSLFGLA